MMDTSAGGVIPKIVHRGFQKLFIADASGFSDDQLNERCSERRSTQGNR
jgi:hypothetical protein